MASCFDFDPYGNAARVASVPNASAPLPKIGLDWPAQARRTIGAFSFQSNLMRRRVPSLPKSGGWSTMRHLFMPACVCLATLSGTLGSDPELSLAQFSGDPLVNQKSSEDTVPADNDAGESSREKDAPRDLGEFLMFSPDAATGFDGNWELSPVPPPLPPRSKPIVHRSRQEICDTLAEAAQSNGVPAPFFIRLLFQESGFKPGVVSSTGAEGIALVRRRFRSFDIARWFSRHWPWQERLWDQTAALLFLS